MLHLRKERNVLFNDTLNTFYLRLYGIGHMVKDHMGSFSNYQKGFIYMHHPTDRIAHTTAFVTLVVEHWLERDIAQWVHFMKDRSDDISHHERTLLLWSYILFPVTFKCYKECDTTITIHLFNNTLNTFFFTLIWVLDLRAH